MRKSAIAAIVAAAIFTLGCGLGAAPDNDPTPGSSSPIVVTAPQSADPTPAVLETSAAPASAVPVKAGPATTFGDGIWRVGIDIAPGTYRTTTPEDAYLSCYWERLSGFGGSFNEIIANGNGKPNKQVVVEIRKTDKGFDTDDCGTWVKIK